MLKGNSHAINQRCQMRILLITILVFVFLSFGAGFFLASTTMSIQRQTLDEARIWQEEHYDLSWYAPLKKENYTVNSYDGYVLHVQRLKNPNGSNRFVIISHGYTDNRFGALKYAWIYLNHGFDVIVYDLRGHGENKPTFCTYSNRESRDLNVLIRDCRVRYHPSVLGVHGESLGAATSVSCLKEKPDIDFVVADCGFSEISAVLKAGIRKVHLPECLVSLASVCAKIRYGYSYNEMRPIESLNGNEIPILFIHGAGDSFILPDHSRKMHEAAKDCSELQLIPFAGHAASVLTAPTEYEVYVTEFLSRHGIPI